MIRAVAKARMTKVRKRSKKPAITEAMAKATKKLAAADKAVEADEAADAEAEAEAEEAITTTTATKPIKRVTKMVKRLSKTKAA